MSYSFGLFLCKYPIIDLVTFMPTELLKSALDSNWRMLMEDIGIWVPVNVTNPEHDDKPANEPEGYF
jgi:hypothetical protein